MADPKALDFVLNAFIGALSEGYSAQQINAAFASVGYLRAPKCEMCGGRGVVGGWAGGVSGGYESIDCPECTEKPNLLATLTQLCFVIRTGGDVLKACEGAEAQIAKVMGGAS